MKTLSLAAAALGLLAVAIPGAASAQRWQSINSRQATVDARIDQGIRSGQLDRREAGRLRAEFRQLNQLEYRYRANGLSASERRDLDRRYDSLSARARFEKHDRQHRRY